jgi:uncharacterized protein DUF1206
LASIYANPHEARGLSGALQALGQQLLGPWVLSIVAFGLAAYGLHIFGLACYRRIRV